MAKYGLVSFSILQTASDGHEPTGAKLREVLAEIGDDAEIVSVSHAVVGAETAGRAAVGTYVIYKKAER